MRILFLGTSPFATPTLTALAKSTEHIIIGVVTQPDRPHGRGGKDLFSPVKTAALALDLPLHQPDKVRTRTFREQVAALNPDVLVVAAFGQLISGRMLEIPPYGGINVHGSLLPRWRGAAPMQYALMNGDVQTGVTTMQMDPGLDTGDILLSRSIPLQEINDVAELEARLSIVGAELLLETLERLQRGDCPRTRQDPLIATLAPSLAPDIGAIDWNLSATSLHNLVRGVTPKPGAYTLWQGKRLKIWSTEPLVGCSQSPGQPGIIQNIAAHGITVSAGQDALLLKDVQPESKARMSAADWARGARVPTGSLLSGIK